SLCVVNETVASANSGSAERSDVVTGERPSGRSQRRWHFEAVATPSVHRTYWPILTSETLGTFAGAVSKYEGNLAAIALLRELETTQRSTSPEERLVLQRYTGWGGIPASFNSEADDPGWA